jgi:uncharacterized repeat protein (TIGR01451 family)
MSAHRKAGRLSRRLGRSPHLITAAILTFVAVPAYFATSAGASTGTLFGGFEIDGTIVNGDLTPVSGLDWDSGVVGTQPIRTDPIGGADTSVFTGSKEDAPLGWRLKANAPGKDDIGAVYEFDRTDPVTGHQFLYFAFERASNVGTVNFVVELNQNANIINSHGVSVPDRATGDIRFNVTQNGNAATLAAHGVDQFDGTKYVALASPPADFASAVNTAPIPALTPADPVGAANGGNIPAGQFAEFGFDLTLLTPAGKPCFIPPFTELNSRSRASDTPSAEVKDFIAPVSLNLPGSCFDLTIHKFKEDGTTPLTGATFSISPNPNTGVAGSSLTVVDGGLNDADNTADGVIEFSNAVPLPAGSNYTVTETAAPGGYLLAAAQSTTGAPSFGSQTLSFTDTLGSVTFTKVDAATNTAQCCAHFQLAGTAGAANGLTINVVDNGLNDDDSPANTDGTITVTGLKTGTWTVTETQAPSGFDVDTTVPSFTISDANPTRTLTAPTFSDPAAQTHDVGITKTDDPDPVNVGDVLTWKITVRNSGTAAAGAIQVTDTVPATSPVVSVPAHAGVPGAPKWTCAWSGPGGNVLTCDWPAGLAAGADTDDITVQALVPDSAIVAGTTSGSMSNTATVAMAGDTQPANDTSTATTTVHAPDLRMIKEGSPNPVIVGSPLTYTLHVRNVGDGPAKSGISVTDSLDASLTPVSASGTNWTCTIVGQDVTCTWAGAAVPANTSLDDITIVVTPNVVTPAPGVANTAAVATAHDPNAANNSSTIHTVVAPTPADPAVTFTQSCGPPTSISVDMTNAGGTDEDLVITKPDGTTEKVTVPANTAVAITKTYTVSGAQQVSVSGPDLVGSPLTQVFTLGCAGPPPPAVPNLTLAKSSLPASGATVQRGDSITYTLAYANTGTGAATGTLTSDTLPADTTFVSASAGGAYDAATNTVSWAVGTVSAGASGTVSFVVKVANSATDGEVITNVGNVSAAGVAPITSNPVTVTVVVPATPTPTLDLVKKVNKSDAEFGDTLTYTFTALAGGVDQTGVEVSDEIPAGATYVPSSATCSTGCSASLAGGVLTWSIGDLAQGDSVELTYKVTVDTPDADADGGIPAVTIVNVGTIASNEIVDPVDSNTVKTDITAVLGVTHHRQPHVQPTHHSRLPFTGLPLLRLLLMAAGAVCAGSLLVHAARTRRELQAPPGGPAED